MGDKAVKDFSWSFRKLEKLSFDVLKLEPYLPYRYGRMYM